MLEIRPLATRDRDAFVAMVRTYLAEIAPTLDPPSQDRIARVWHDSDRHAFTFYDPAICGFALIRTLPNAVTELSEFYIAPTHRRQGLGQQAARDIIHRFPGRWHLGIAAGSPHARAFWMRALTGLPVKRGPPLTPHQSGSLHFTVTESVT